jgi:hypothetical protein
MPDSKLHEVGFMAVSGGGANAVPQPKLKEKSSIPISPA